MYIITILLKYEQTKLDINSLHMYFSYSSKLKQTYKLSTKKPVKVMKCKLTTLFQCNGNILPKRNCCLQHEYGAVCHPRGVLAAFVTIGALFLPHFLLRCWKSRVGTMYSDCTVISFWSLLSGSISFTYQGSLLFFSLFFTVKIVCLVPVQMRKINVYVHLQSCCKSCCCA